MCVLLASTNSQIARSLLSHTEDLAGFPQTPYLTVAFLNLFESMNNLDSAYNFKVTSFNGDFVYYKRGILHIHRLFHFKLTQFIPCSEKAVQSVLLALGNVSNIPHALPVGLQNPPELHVSSCLLESIVY
jgi:hypothetical protein